MGVEEVDLDHVGWLTQRGFHRAQVPGASGEGFGGRLLHLLGWMLFCEREQALDGADSLDRPMMLDGLRPGASGRPDLAATGEQIVDAAIDQTALERMDMLVAGRRPARHCADVSGDRLH